MLGPTGVGKSKVAVGLARCLGGEIISADSMQVYKDFNIGTDKIRPQQMQGVPHHLIDIYCHCEQFNGSRFLEAAHRAAEEILSRGGAPIVCGGTALYLRLMIQGIFVESESRRVSREQLNAIVARRGLDCAWKRLHAVDPDYALRIGPNDRIRIVRALEIYYNNGLPPSELFRENRSPFEGYDFIRIGLNVERQLLYERIEERVNRMIAEGFAEEVRRLRRIYPLNCPPFKSMGYKEMLMYMDGALKLDQAVELMKQRTRNFAKRQLSWFRKEKGVEWFDPGDMAAIEAYVRQRLSGAPGAPGETAG